MSSYTIAEHGDILEKEATDFIHKLFPFYESVWQIYIGHQGNGMMAEIPGYSKAKLREQFSQGTYTILESAFIINEILNSGIFSQPIKLFPEYFEFNKAFVSFFSHIGRIKDNLEKATTGLMGSFAANKLKEKLDAFYQSRNVVLHGKKVPFRLDELGLIKMPLLYKEFQNTMTWDDKGNVWSDFDKFRAAYVADECEKMFNDLMAIVNNEFAGYHNYLQNHLKIENANLKFSYLSQGAIKESSGGIAVFPINDSAVSSSR